MATSYPDKTNARGIWKISDITKNKKTEGTWPNAGVRALIGGGNRSSPGASQNIIESVIINVLGDATDFGDLSIARDNLGGTGNHTRALWSGGHNAGTTYNTIDYVTSSTLGNAADFGDLTVARRQTNALANNTRGVFAGSRQPGAGNVIDYVTIASIGDAVDFGDLTVARWGTSTP